MVDTFEQDGGAQGLGLSVAQGKPRGPRGSWRAVLKTIGELKLVPVWVNPDHLVSTCRLLLSGHRLSAIGVVDNGSLVGTVSFEELAGVDDARKVREVMSPALDIVQGSSSIRSVAALMTQEGLNVVPVVQDGRFLGMVSAVMLLKEMSRTWDPLTGLSWSDRLRDWGVENLKNSNEVIIIFLDLDDFGLYNKRYGHTVGDRVLQKVAKHLSDSVDPETDVLVRFGGDEFAIGTTRTRRDAEQLVDLIIHRVEGLFISESERPVSISIGMMGGRRTHERENIHFAATLDNLINLASKECMAAKAAKKAENHAEAALASPTDDTGPHMPKATPTPVLDVADVVADASAERSVTMVTLSHPGGVVRGVHARSAQESVYESIAQATLNAVERLGGDANGIRLDHVGVKGEGTAKIAVRARDEVFAVERIVAEDRLMQDVAAMTLEAIRAARGE